MKLKICGMKYQDNIATVAQLQPNYMGFIFYDKSSRFFNTKNIPELPDSIVKTGVFVNADINYVIEKIEEHNLNAIQLHGEETPQYCAQLKAYYSLKLEKESLNLKEKPTIELIKVFSIKNEFNFDILTPYENVVDYFLFDTKGKLPGGNGYTFNWDILKHYPSTKPYFLSGGIGLNEVNQIKDFKKNPASKYCFAIDVNSKFEIEPGLKDAHNLKNFTNNLVAN